MNLRNMTSNMNSGFNESISNIKDSATGKVNEMLGKNKDGSKIDINRDNMRTDTSRDSATGMTSGIGEKLTNIKDKVLETGGDLTGGIGEKLTNFKDKVLETGGIGEKLTNI